MRIVILGADGYLGWPTAMQLAALGHDVWAVDNYLRRRLAIETCSEPLFPTPNLHDRVRIFTETSEREIEVRIGDCRDMRFMGSLFAEVRPDAVIHFAEQPSAPFSQMGYEQARITLNNNLNTTFNVIWAVLENCPECHVIKLGTMGEYGTPNIDIEEGWIEIEHKGRKDRFLYPRQASSLYHTTKILDTDLLWFYVRQAGLRVTDLMQGPVYGLSTAEADVDERLMPNFHYDDIFGTVVNRFLVQAVAGLPLTVYGKGGQTRGYLNLCDTLQCIRLALENPVEAGELRILNQFTEQFSVRELAERVQRVGTQMGLDVSISSIENPRQEEEEHYYNAQHSGLTELGLKPTLMTDEVIAHMLEKIIPYRDGIDPSRVMPRVRWRGRR